MLSFSVGGVVIVVVLRLEFGIIVFAVVSDLEKCEDAVKLKSTYAFKLT